MGMIFFWVGVIIELVSPYVFINVLTYIVANMGLAVGSKWFTVGHSTI